MASPAWLRRLDQLGRLLPTTLRERVFEPACLDLVLGAPSGSSRAGLGPRFLAVFVWVVAANLPRALFERRRPTGAGVLVGTVCLIALGILLVGVWYLRSFNGYPAS